MIDASTLNNLDDLIEGMPLNARILEIIKAGYTRAEIARAAGKTNSAVTQWISGEVKEIKASSAAGIQARTGYNSVWIATGKGPKLIASAQEQAQYTDFYGGGDNVPTTITRLKRVWVVGRASGGVMPGRIWTDGDYPAGATENYGEIASADPLAFLIDVAGTSMVPRYNPGEFALVEPGTDPEIEDDVLVRCKNGTTLLKRLLSKRGGYMFGSWNSPEILHYPLEDISWVYYVAHPVPRRKIKSRS